MKKLLTTVLAGTAALAMSAAAQAGTLDEVKARGELVCGVSQGLPGFSNKDDAGNYTGLDVEFCRAVAAAVLGDAQKVRFTPLSASDRFTALSSREVDVLARNTTWTITRDTQLGLTFAGVNYYDGQGLMVRKDLGVTSAKELEGATICTNTGTTTELNITDYFRKHNMNFQLVTLENSNEVVAAYDGGRCDVFTTDRSGLAGERLKLANPDAHVVLPEIISKEPLGPVVRQGDDQWFAIVRWVHIAMLNAEEAGITQANVDSMMSSADPNTRRLLGVEGNFGSKMGLSDDWSYQIIKQVGNYAESYDRNVGPDTPLKLDRGLNALWVDGGLQYGMPIR